LIFAKVALRKCLLNCLARNENARSIFMVFRAFLLWELE